MKPWTPIVVFCAALPAQVDWTPAEYLDNRSAHAMAFDAARGRIVLFGGVAGALAADTWEFDGQRWTQRFPNTVPPGRFGHAMEYDPVRRRVVMFGGSFRADMWEWNGVDWIQRTPATSPSGRLGHAMAFDAVRQRLVLFGGSVGLGGNQVWLNDTWEWDGASWVQRTPPTVPVARASHAMVFEAVRRRVVLFGGGTRFARLGDTWEWDGTNWIQASPALSPPPRESHSLAYDLLRQRVVLFGGRDAQLLSLADTWEWNGSIWVPRSVTGPPARYAHAAVFDAARTVVVGGFTVAGAAADTWAFDGARWSLVAGSPSPAARIYGAMAYDAARRRSVLFGGLGLGILGDTWEWDAGAWTQRTPAVSPTPRYRHAVAYDASRGRLVLFGGFGLAGELGDTWEYDGTAWSQRNPAAGPGPRFLHAVTYDAGRRRVVLFGGIAGRNLLDETWEWDGTRWQQIRTARTPPARHGTALAWDALRKRVVMFGGNAGGLGGFLADTWEYDGVSWNERFPGTSPPKRAEHALCFDARRGCIVLFGGGPPGLDDTWEWDGNNWVQQLPASRPAGRQRQVMAFEDDRGVMVMFGGAGGSGSFSDTWDYHTRALIQSGGNPRPGGTVTLDLTSPEDARLPYNTLSSLGPGPMVAGNRKLPLAFDGVLLATLAGTSPAVFANYTGTLDGQGKGQSMVRIPPINALIGLTIYSAFVTISNTAPMGISSVSNHVAFTIR